MVRFNKRNDLDQNTDLDTTAVKTSPGSQVQDTPDEKTSTLEHHPASEDGETSSKEEDDDFEDEDFSVGSHCVVSRKKGFYFKVLDFDLFSLLRSMESLLELTLLTNRLNLSMLKARDLAQWLHAELPTSGSWIQSPVKTYGG